MSRVLRLALAVTASTALYATAVAGAPLATPLMLLVALPGLIVATGGPVSECGLWLLLTGGGVTSVLGADATPGFVLPFGIPAVVMAAAVRRFWPFERTVVAGVLAWGIGVLGLALLAFGNLADTIAAVRQQLTNSIDLALSTYSSMGANEGALATLAAERDSVVTALVETLPALIVLTGALTTIVNLIMLRSWTNLPDGGNLRLWRTPDSLIWALILTGFGMFVPVPAVALLARNLFIVVLGCYFCQGLAIVSYYLERFRLPRGLRVAGYVLIAIQHVVAAMVLVLGVFDLWGNFRRLNVGPADVPFHTDGE